MWYRRFLPNSVGARSALAVNLLVAGAGIAFVVADYWRESCHRLADKAASLRTQAMTIHQAVVATESASTASRQQLIDAVCSRTSDADFPGHHIVVEAGGRVWQSRTHDRDSDELLAAVRSADKTLIIGRHAEDGVTVYAAEKMSNVRPAIRHQVIVNSGGIVVFGLTLSVAITLVLRRLVHRPLRRLVRVIDEITKGKLGATATPDGGEELARLAAAVNTMSQSLAKAESRRRASLDRARQVQENLLPTGRLANGLAWAAYHLAAEDVGGDYFDIIPMADGGTLLCVADVVGHGIPAAMVAAMLKVILLDAAESHNDPGEILCRANRRLAAVTLPEDFVTVFLAKWIPSARALRYASAGHEPGLVQPAGGTPTTLGSTGSLIGIDPDGAWETEEVRVEPGSLLVCWSDGISEAGAAAGTPFGRERLASLVRSCSTGTPDQVVTAIGDAMLKHNPCGLFADDCTAVVVRLE